MSVIIIFSLYFISNPYKQLNHFYSFLMIFRFGQTIKEFVDVHNRTVSAGIPWVNIFLNSKIIY